MGGARIKDYEGVGTPGGCRLYGAWETPPWIQFVDQEAGGREGGPGENMEASRCEETASVLAKKTAEVHQGKTPSIRALGH